MAVVTISSIKFVSGQISQTLTMAENAVAGDWVNMTMNGPNSKLYKANADDVNRASVYGILLVGANTDGIAIVAKPGCIVDVGAVLTKATVYILSPTAGKMQLTSDLATGDYCTVVGIALTNSLLLIGVIDSGVIK